MRAYGPGLEGGKVGKSADFVVETTGNDVGQLGMSIDITVVFLDQQKSILLGFAIDCLQ